MKTLLAMCLVFASTLTAIGQGVTNLTADAVLQQAGKLNGKTILVSGVVDHIEKDALAVDTFLVVLEGGVRCRLQVASFSPRGFKAQFKSKGVGDLGLYVTGRRTVEAVGGMPITDTHVANERILAKGEEITIRGTVKLATQKIVLDGATVKTSGYSVVRSILRLDSDQ